MHIPGAQIMASITILHGKKPRLPEEMADSSPGGGKEQDEPGTFYCIRKQGSLQRLMGLCQKDPGSNVERLSLVKVVTIWISKKVMSLVD